MANSICGITNVAIPATPPKKIRASNMKEQAKQSLNIIKKYMASRDIPEWFRGTSNFQVTAANLLFESLLYDMEQHTSHRVRACLVGMGLKPMLTDDQIKFLIRMSRGSDLAFLWFMLELHYQTDGPQYSVNEQLILSTIAHLDMVTTLRELDKILPPPVKPPKTPKFKSKERRLRIEKVAAEHYRKTMSPYFAPITSPKPWGKPTTMKRPDFRVSMGDYEVWADPNYVVQNESNRWFANYQPRAVRRVVHSILKEEIAKIFDDPLGTSESAKQDDVLCEYHKCMLAMEKNLKKELMVIARERCRKHFDVDGVRKSRARARITAQLEKDVDMFLQRFRTYAGRIPDCKRDKYGNAPIQVLLGGDTVEYCEPVSSDEIRSSATCGICEQLVITVRKQPPAAKETKGSCNCMCFGGGSKESVCEESSCSDENDSCKKSISPINLVDCEKLEGARRNSVQKGNNRSSKAVLTVRCADDDPTLTPRSSKLFFVAAKEHKPWHFDYQKIFNFKNPLIKEETNVKKQCVEAVNSEMSFATRLENEAQPNIDGAVDKYTKRTWTRSVNEYNEEHWNPTCKEVLEDAAAKADQVELPIDFGIDCFNPDNRPLMMFMLQIAFEVLKRDPKFVLATLPEAYKLPSFIYFIQNRYGKLYSEEERLKLYLQSLKILRALEKLTKRVPMPRIKRLCQNPFVSYACRDYILAKGGKTKQEYYAMLDAAIMNQARVFWFAMRPYLCPSGPPRNTYFAYMPSRIVDITRFRQWKSTEFMNAKGQWDRRQRLKRTQIFK